MKKFTLFLLFIFLSLNLFAGLDENITIEGVIGTTFDKKKVQVYDNLGQTFFLPRNVFPSDFKPQSAKPFSVEVSEELFNSLEIKQSDKKIKVEFKLEK
jgi:hypothetical protein